jgi:hypothetical protein
VFELHFWAKMRMYFSASSYYVAVSPDTSIAFFVRFQRHINDSYKGKLN